MVKLDRIVPAKLFLWPQTNQFPRTLGVCITMVHLPITCGPFRIEYVMLYKERDLQMMKNNETKI